MDLSRPKTPVTITFSVPGTIPPVYVASSLTNPTWVPMEMDVKSERTDSGDLIFEKKFDAVESGEYQYKFRLGPGDWWVCDESAPIVCDDAGNRNNSLVVKPPSLPAESHEAPTLHSLASAPDLRAEDSISNGVAQDAEDSKLPEEREQVPVPITVVDKVQDAEQPVSDQEPARLEELPEKRAADAEPDAEYETTETAPSHAEQEVAHSLEPVPAVVIEKVDNTPKHGDDLGLDATPGQQLAHEKRAADAVPDKVVVAGDVEEQKDQEPLHSEVNGKPKSTAFDDELDEELHDDADEEPAPLLPHETFREESDEAPLLPHEQSAAVSSESESESESEGEAVANDLEPVEFDGDTPLFRHESFNVSRDESPPHSPLRQNSHSHTSLKDMMAEEDPNDPSLEPFPTRRETIYEHIQALENRLEEDKFIPDESEDSSLRRASRSSSGDIPPPSPLDSIQEDEYEEEVEHSSRSTVPVSTELTDERPATACTVGTVPTPPMTPKDDQFNQRLDRADSVVTVTSEERPKDSPHNTDGAKDGTGLNGPEIALPKPSEPEPTPAKPAEQEPAQAKSAEPVSIQPKSSQHEAVQAKSFELQLDHPKATEPESAQPKLSQRELFELEPSSERESFELQPASPRAADDDDNRSIVTISPKNSAEARKNNFLISFWNSLFGGWLGPVVRWFTRICGGKGRATVLACAVTAAVVAYSYESTLVTEVAESPGGATDSDSFAQGIGNSAASLYLYDNDNSIEIGRGVCPVGTVFS